MIQSHYSRPAVIVEAPDPASRFRETRRTVEDELRSLEGTGQAVPADPSGCWKKKKDLGVKHALVFLGGR